MTKIEIYNIVEDQDPVPDIIRDWLKLNAINSKFDDSFLIRLFETLGDESKVIKVLEIVNTSCQRCYTDEREGQCRCGHY